VGFGQSGFALMNKKNTDTRNKDQGAKFKVQTLSLAPRTSKGFTLIELVIVISIVGVLASMLFSRVLFYQEMAEKAAMQQVVSALKSALVLEYGHRMTLSMGSAINDISTENPMDWLSQKPVNYAGAFNSIKPGTIEAGNWAFDLNTRELIYIPRHAEYFSPSKDGVKWVRFRMRSAYDAGLGSQGRRVMELTGVTIAPVESYQWLIPVKQYQWWGQEK
jgi:prepilin-type N-terminal cleavage/methylation domain-containing protein